MYWKDCLEEFLAFKQAQGLSPRTIGDYRGIIGRFFKECPSDAFPDDCKLHLLKFMAKPAAPNYYNIKLVYLSCWLVPAQWRPTKSLAKFYSAS